ncbi:hypothetical protein H4R33_004955 [Dimargaris cristalligena]|nr:hypothetical protein H4R33_004955 [Dimargaris cristalligena]
MKLSWLAIVSAGVIVGARPIVDQSGNDAFLPATDGDVTDGNPPFRSKEAPGTGPMDSDFGLVKPTIPGDPTLSVNANEPVGDQTPQAVPADSQDAAAATEPSKDSQVSVETTDLPNRSPLFNIESLGGLNLTPTLNINPFNLGSADAMDGGQFSGGDIVAGVLGRMPSSNEDGPPGSRSLPDQPRGSPSTIPNKNRPTNQGGSNQKANRSQVTQPQTHPPTTARAGQTTPGKNRQESSSSSTTERPEKLSKGSTTKPEAEKVPSASPRKARPSGAQKVRRSNSSNKSAWSTITSSVGKFLRRAGQAGSRKK